LTPDYEAESINWPRWSRHRPAHIVRSLGLRKLSPIGALNNRSARRTILNRLAAKNVPALVASCLAVPSDVIPTGAYVIREYEAFEFCAAKVLKMDTLDGTSRVRHMASLVY
jgi:hypothetical protein